MSNKVFFFLSQDKVTEAPPESQSDADSSNLLQSSSGEPTFPRSSFPRLTSEASFEPETIGSSGSSSTVTGLAVGLGVSLFVIAVVAGLGLLIVRVPG